ncbi:PPOX class F420-dependent oxidoreductase [Nocardia sp. NPDC051990]|uniref:PPOX class F420-dependent oxidoreductase n=1 Tax=Nocardia sp. NPDC051990 TaxID=3155285 RepID=UPI00342CBCEB
MDPAQALDFLRLHHHAVLSTFGKDGRLQLSPVVVALDGADRVVLSTTKTRAKARNLQRDPRVSACVFTRPFFGPWIHIEGTAEILPPTLGLDLEALKNLHDALSDEYPDWETFNRGIHADERVAIRFTIERASGITEQ